MSKVYMARCIVKKDGHTYQKGSLIKGLAEKEINKGLEQGWLEAVGIEDEPAGLLEEEPETLEEEPETQEEKPDKRKPGRPLKNNSEEHGMAAMNRDQLIALAMEKGVEIDDSMADDELVKKISEAQK